jgi:hypothetical protein
MMLEDTRLEDHEAARSRFEREKNQDWSETRIDLCLFKHGWFQQKIILPITSQRVLTLWMWDKKWTPIARLVSFDPQAYGKYNKSILSSEFKEPRQITEFTHEVCCP